MTGVIVVGGGVGGLATAVVLGRAGPTVTVLERDPLPADADPEAAFRSERSGAPQALRMTPPGIGAEFLAGLEA